MSKKPTMNPHVKTMVEYFNAHHEVSKEEAVKVTTLLLQDVADATERDKIMNEALLITKHPLSKEETKPMSTGC